MNKWRPEGWENPYPRPSTYPPLTETYRSAFEAGADAMLDALFKMASESPTGKFEIAPEVVNVYFCGINAKV